MIWWVTDDSTGEQLRDGRVPLQLLSTVNVGLRLEVQGTIDLSGIDPSMLEERLTVAVALEARDFAGNDAVHLLDARGQSGADGAWAMEYYRPGIRHRANGGHLRQPWLDHRRPDRGRSRRGKRRKS